MGERRGSNTKGKSRAAETAVWCAMLGLGAACVWPGGKAMSGLGSHPFATSAGEGGATRYYEALMSGEEPPAGGESERAAGDAVDLGALGISRVLRGDALGYELIPGSRGEVLGSSMGINGLGLRDRDEYVVEKRPGASRIALLGSSIEMGWGVEDGETYENLVEDWLRERGTDAEIWNLGRAAYDPMRRVEYLRRKIDAWRPDAVLLACTMLDPRLTEIGPRRDDAGSRSEDETAWLSDSRWRVEGDEALRVLAEECRARGIAFYCVIVPRAGGVDEEARRSVGVAAQLASARRHGLEAWDLSGAFDGVEASKLTIATGDPHPNALGHRLLAEALLRAMDGSRSWAHRGTGTAAAERGARR